jgi:tRNA threonylcarbamoyladenosine biosynthesis protein TsaB
VLALDTCLGAVSVAVRWQDGAGQWQMRHALERRERGQAERLMPMLAEVMAQTGLAFTDLHRIAATVGPGGFTGVRVGVAAARGLALACGLPVVAATSLAVMAHQALGLIGAERGERLLAVAADARRDMAYLQLFAGAQDALEPPQLVTPHDAADAIGARPVIVVGSGAELVAAAVKAAGGNAEAALADLQPDARALAVLAAGLTPVAALRPLYVREPDVKPQADGLLTGVAR